MLDEEYHSRGPVIGRRFSLVFGGFWLLMFLATFLVAGSWTGFHGVLFLAVGLLMALCPPEVRLPRVWIILAAVFMITSLAAFLPAEWFGIPEWRRQLETLGVPTGPMVVIQGRMAAESLAVFWIMLVAGLWLAGHRASSVQLRTWALAFTMGVAVYAVLSKLMQGSDWQVVAGMEGHFGFFPNRNHSGTYLAMGAVCGLGSLMQAIRDRNFLRLGFAVVATFICFLAVIGWSVSRGGVLLVAVGSLAWIFMLGSDYLGRNGRRAVALLGLAIIGGFLIADTSVKQRLSATMEKTSGVISSGEPSQFSEGKTPAADVRDLDFRIPTALDTLGLIKDFKWTGIGAGQFYYVFPQYRNLTAVANDSDNYHPESDWLWMASETGIPATLALVALVALAFWKSLRAILKGRHRALRASCLVAAMLVPLHGIFDVPGHRITLAWSAVFLFCLALRPPHPGSPASQSVSTWPARVAALVLALAGIFLVRAEWWGGGPPALMSAKLALADARQLYEKDQALQKSPGSPVSQDQQPAPGADLLETALVRLGQAAKLTPLDRGILRYEGFLALHFDDERDLARKVFLVERSLDPTWIKAPLEQAFAWSNADPEETVALWNEAIGRARWLDGKHPPGKSFEAATRSRIREQASRNPILEPLRKDRIGE